MVIEQHPAISLNPPLTNHHLLSTGTGVVERRSGGISHSSLNGYGPKSTSSAVGEGEKKSKERNGLQSSGNHTETKVLTSANPCELLHVQFGHHLQLKVPGMSVSSSSRSIDQNGDKGADDGDEMEQNGDGKTNQPRGEDEGEGEVFEKDLDSGLRRGDGGRSFLFAGDYDIVESFSGHDLG